MALNSMHDLLIEELREILDAEKQAGRSYPKLIRAVSSDSLKQAFRDHGEETKGQIERINEIFEQMDTRSRGKTCEALRGLVEDAQEIIEKGLEPELLDVAIIAAAQKMEHFEIAAYGSAAAHAKALGLADVAKLLGQTLDEEKAMDERLNKIALEEVNKTALEAEEGGGEEIDRAAAGNKPGRSAKGR